MNIEFKPIPECPGYFVSSGGMVISTNGLKGHKVWFLSQYFHTTGCMGVDLFVRGRKRKCKVHRLVAIAWIPNPDQKPQVNHKNGDRTDNQLANLEWVTDSENKRHAWQILKRPRGKHAASKMQTIYQPIVADLKSGMKQATIAKKYGVSPSVISGIKTGKRVLYADGGA